MSPVQLTVTPRRARPISFASPLKLIFIFIGLIIIGTVLLSMPFANRTGEFTPFMDALFTATSAITVTGLVIQDTADYWTKTGQVVIMVLIFVGGLGFMTMACFLLILVGHRFTLAEGILMKDGLQLDHLSGLANLTVKVVIITVALQMAGFAALTSRFYVMPDYTMSEALWQAAFLSVSSFNSAGFVIFAEGSSVSSLQTDKVILGIMTALICLGSVGYWVIVDIATHLKFSLYTLNTKLVLVITVILLGAGSIFFFFSEQYNALDDLQLLDKFVVSIFESTSGRTAGFTSVDYKITAHYTNFFVMILMFIGGASASVAGGIKVNTLGVVMANMGSTIRGKKATSVFRREIPPIQVDRATTIILMGIISVVVVTMVLALTESDKDIGFANILFESVSALGTNGLSTGITATLSGWGHLVLIVAMFVGRMGPIALSISMAMQRGTVPYRYAKERVTLG